MTKENEQQIVAIYARVSTADQDHSMQLEELRALAKARGWFIKEYVDTGNGSNPDLPQRRKMLYDAEWGQIDIVLVWRFDRFARSTKQLIEALDSFKAWGVEFISAHEGIDTTTPMGRFAFTVFAAIAEFEREIIRERITAGIKKAKQNGTRTGNPIGRPRRQVDIAEARRLYEDGRSWVRVARAMGIPRSTLRQALREDEERKDGGRDHDKV